MAEYRVTLDVGGLNRDFVFIGGPLEEPDGKEKLFEALGYACAQWARMEQHIDSLLMHINNDAHSDTIFDPEHPVSFLKKIDLLKKWFNKHPALASLQEDVRLLTSKLKGLSQHRNNLIHGTLERWDSDRTTAEFCTIKTERGGTFKISSHEYTIQGILHIASLTSASNNYLSAITKNVFTPSTLEQLRK